MNTSAFLKHGLKKEDPKLGSSLSFRRLSTYVCVSFGAAVFVSLVLILMFRGPLLNGYGKAKLERAFAQTHPGYALRIGNLDYSFGANRLIAQTATLTGPTCQLKTAQISLTGIHWLAMLRKTAPLSRILEHARLVATNVAAEFPQSRYRLCCARLEASVPDSELVAEGTELGPLVEDEAFFSAHDFRTTRFHAVVPECRVAGLAYVELIEAKSYRARSIQMSRPSLDALVNRDKALPPFLHSPLMVDEALATVLQPLQIDSLVITNGNVTYRERLVAGAEPGVLTFGAVNLSVEGIANRAVASSVIVLRAQSKFMNAGVLKLLITIPVASPNFSLHYSGSLTTIDLTHLDAFLEVAEHLRIKSGIAQEAAFDVDVTASQARGHVRATYSNLEVAVLDKHTGSEKGFENRLSSFFANVFKIRNSNGLDASGSMKEGKVNYTRGAEDEFQQFLWFALRTGVLDVISH